MCAQPTHKKTKFGTVILSDGTLDYQFRGEIALNRSRKWIPAQTYKRAREQSPSSRPVR